MQDVTEIAETVRITVSRIARIRGGRYQRSVRRGALGTRDSSDTLRRSQCRSPLNITNPESWPNDRGQSHAPTTLERFAGIARPAAGAALCIVQSTQAGVRRA